MQIINDANVNRETSTGLGPRVRMALAALGLLSAFGPISLDLYLPSLPRVAADLASSDALAQLTLSGSLAGLAVGQLVVGPLSDRIGRRRPLLIGLAGFALLSVLCALAPTIWLLVAARFAQGLCGAAGLVIARAVVRDAFPDAQIAEVFSALMLINGLAPVLAPLIGGQLLHLMSWRGLFWVLAAVGLTIGGLTAAALPETLPPARRHGGGLRTVGGAVREVCADRMFLAATAILALASSALFIYISLSSFVLQTTFGLSASEFSAVFAMNSVGIVLGGRVSARALRRWSSGAVLGAGLLVMLTGSAVLLWAAEAGEGLAVLLPPLFVVLAMVGVVLPNATAIALLRHGRSAGTASALLGALQYLAGAVAGPLAALGGASTVALASGMFVTLVAAFAVWAAVLRREAVPAEPVATAAPVIEASSSRASVTPTSPGAESATRESANSCLVVVDGAA